MPMSGTPIVFAHMYFRTPVLAANQVKCGYCRKPRARPVALGSQPDAGAGAGAGQAARSSNGWIAGARAFSNWDGSALVKR